MNFSGFAGRREPGKNDSGHTFPDGDRITDLELGLIRAADNGMPGFFHVHGVSSSSILSRSWSELGIGVNVGEPAPYYADRCRAWLDIPARVPAAPRVSHRPLGRRCSTYWFQSFRRHLTNPNRPASTTQFGTATNHEGTRISDHDKPGWSRTAAGHHSPRWALRDQVDSSVCAAMRLRASERGNVESVIALPTVCKLTSFRMAFHNPGYEVGLTRRAGLDN